MPPNIDLTPIAVILAFTSALFGPKIAALVGAYAIILIGWFAGLLYGLYTRAPESKMPVWAYAVFTFIMCFLVTVPTSILAVSYIPWVNVDYTSVLGIVSALIPAFPDRWGELGVKALEFLQRLRGAKQ
jgi:hypothetical protein